MPRPSIISVLLTTVALSVCARSFADDTAVDFARDVRPILEARCFACHGPDAQESGLRLDDAAIVLRGGDSGEPSVVPGASVSSYLISRITDADPKKRMPPDEDPLPASEIDLLKRWIDQGASGVAEASNEELTTDFWSFQPLGHAAVLLSDDSWIRNPIDSFILAKLQESGLRPSPDAERLPLIRRLYLDVLGLPPSPEEIAAFLEDVRPDAYERLVDQVLASPHYGERWARHWLDVVRFAETDGFEMNQERPNAWHYRDYVIGALNRDKPYNEFLFEQIAGDSLGIDAATGFLVGGAMDKVKSPDLALTLQQRQDELADMINTTGTTFLGLTLGCARCHNHKFDPVLQKDYYALQAIFAGVKHGERPMREADDPHRLDHIAQLEEQLARAESELSVLGLRPPVSARENVETFAPIAAKRLRFVVEATNNNSEPCLDELEVFAAASESGGAKNVALASAGTAAESLGDYAGAPIHQLKNLNDGRYGNSHSWISNTPGRGTVTLTFASPVRIDRVAWARDRSGGFEDRLATRYRIETESSDGRWEVIASSEDRLPHPSEGGAFSSDRFRSLPADVAARATQLSTERDRLKKELAELTSGGTKTYAGSFEQPDATHRLYRGDAMSPREVVVPDALTVLGSLQLDRDTPERERRVALAKWMTSPDNPLVPRVIVNRVWHYHFGTGIVATPSDFGANGFRPTHPELLDWLARELIRGDWSLKHVHRTILLSSTYRQASAPNEAGLRVDAGAKLLWRFPPRRLEAEAIRDSMLLASGSLNETMQGPGFTVFEPNNNYVRVYTPKEAFAEPEWRRMVYMHKVRMENDAAFGPFDCPDAGQTMPNRGRSTTAIQALNLLNSSFVLQQSDLFAQRVEREAGSEPGAQVQRAFVLAYGRAPDANEERAAEQLLASHGLNALTRAVLNSNEFLFLP